MRHVGAYEAKTHLPRLLEEVARGETIVITKHGVPVAKLVPAMPQPVHDRTQLIKEFREFRKHHGIKGVRLDEIQGLIEEGRRF